jgi:glyoxylase-like metal-dependent hydrolase (beta-lactamase superfamily II)
MADPRFQVIVIPVTPYQQNCLLIWSTATKIGAVVDPGGDIFLIEEAIKKAGVKVEKILLTHGHVDHAAGAKNLSERLSCPIEGPHKDDQFLLDELPRIALQIGDMSAKAFKPDRYLDEGDQVSIGNIALNVRHIPGHTPGHVVFISEQDDLAIVGDVVFQNSVGRTDFPYGKTQQLLDGIAEKILTLNDDILLFSGHGPVTSIGQERRHNPFLMKLSNRKSAG